MKTLTTLLLGALLLATVAPAAPAEPDPPAPADPRAIQSATQAFAAAHAASDRDAGRLWGMPIYGPLLFVEPQSRLLIANQADAQGALRAEGGLFVGRLPDGVPMANTGTEWSGVRWAMIVLPLPEDPLYRVELMEHELFHRLQPALHLPLASSAPIHLESLEGRTLLRLEWRALAAALKADDPVARRRAVADALTFRAQRRALFPAGVADERGLELNEGLAEDTGCAVAASSPAERRTLALHFLESGERRPTFARTFAYASGPGYGALLDPLAPGWRRGITAGSDLGAILARASDFKVPRDLAAESARRAAAYDGVALRSTETERDRARQAREVAARQRFVSGPHLTLPMREQQISFDPNTLQPIEGLGTVFGTLEVTEAWGTLKVQGGGGALMKGDWSAVTLGAPDDPAATPLQADGWTLRLSAGWKLVPGARPGDLTVGPSM
jgi:hypothetical protein